LDLIACSLDKPIIFTCSQIPLIEKRSDALINVAEALVLAAQYPIAEVCLYFNRKLLRGNRSSKEHSTSFDAFSSPNFPVLGQLGIDVTLNYEQLLTAKPMQLQTVDFIDEAVTVLPLYPGFSAKTFEYIASQTPTKGLILQTFGAGNAPSANLAFMRALEELIDSGVSVINLTLCRAGMVNQTAYASGDALSQLGVIAGADLTTEAAYAKLHCLIGRGYSNDQIRCLLPQSHRGELTLF